LTTSRNASAARQVRLVFRRTGERSRAAEAFLEVVKAGA